MSHALMNNFKLITALLSNPGIIKAKPSVLLFLYQYLRKFKIKNVGGKLFVHSHLPPVNSRAYKRFVYEHLLSHTPKPSHAQVALTNRCPQKCAYCYNKSRAGIAMDTETILRTIRDLKKLGVFWIGFTGGEPLLNKEIVRITQSVGDDCTSKLFTTGCHLTPQLAADLKGAGLASVSISLDHWKEEIHDAARGYRGAFATAVKAIEIFKSLGGVHVGVSAVLSKEMLAKDRAEEYLSFLSGLGIAEAWLSETKPSTDAFWHDNAAITENERTSLIALQDRYNKAGEMTINYLGHFEAAEHFGCTAGHKMIYVDPFGEVNPCVFIPATFGNVKNKPISEIYADMLSHFPTENTCFINKNYPFLQKHFRGQLPLPEDDALAMLEEVRFGPLSRFFALHYGPAGMA